MLSAGRSLAGEAEQELLLKEATVDPHGWFENVS